MLCPPTNAVKTPLLRCLQNTEIILITPYMVLEFVSLRAPSMKNILKCNEHQEWAIWSHSETIIDSLMSLKYLENVNVPEQSGEPLFHSQKSPLGYLGN